MPIDPVTKDNICDYIPFVSTYTNAVDLVQKREFNELAKTNQEEAPPIEDRYVVHIKDKSDLRMGVLLFPIVGNLIVGVYDLFKAFVSLFEGSEEEHIPLIGKPSAFKHVNKKSNDDDETAESLEAKIDSKLAARKAAELKKAAEPYDAETEETLNQKIDAKIKRKQDEQDL